MVRPRELGPDISQGWGSRRSLAQDYLFADPVMLGSQRVGPDLSNFGRRSDLNGILLRLYDPRIVVPGSVMPSYRFLFETRKIQFAPSTNALVLPTELAPATGYEIVPKPKALALAAYLLSLRQDGYLFESPPPPLPSTNSVPPAAAVKK
jgi:cytochrome c oxidase cbb3-type subunit 2